MLAFWRLGIMRGGMVWHPEEKDRKVNEYLEATNHAPYAVIAATIMAIFCAFTVLILLGTF